MKRLTNPNTNIYHHTHKYMRFSIGILIESYFSVVGSDADGRGVGKFPYQTCQRKLDMPSSEISS